LATNPILVLGWEPELRVDFIIHYKQSWLQDHRWLCRGQRSQVEHVMKLTVAAALLATVTFSNAAAQPSSGYRGFPCVARVIQSEELPYAPIGSWLVRVTLEITPPHGGAYQTTLQDYMPWQGPPPRRGQAFRLLCDPANPANLHLIYRPSAPAVF
jgi:hypothetical protein